MGGHIAVLVSGSGTNLQALLDDRVIAPFIALVLSDRPSVGALERAASRGIETVVVAPGTADRGGYTDAVRDVLVARSIDTVVLAGYMRVLGASFFDAFPGRVLNVHPALLPSFPGARAVADALDWGVKVTGVTVHLVDEEVDHGPIVLQEAIDVRDDDTWETLEPRVHAVEHRLLPAAVRALLADRLVVEGRSVRIIEGEPSP
ncbi:MAG: phosphoribosylglycinamide formyltransferase [Actinomycetota bacterium]